MNEKPALSEFEGTVHEQTLLTRALAEMRGEILRHQIRIEDFSDIYGASEIAEDRERVERFEREFTARATPDILNARRLASVFEGIFHRGAHEYKWLGNSAHVIKASDFDDHENGVDGVVEFRKEGGGAAEHLAIGIDVTYSNLLAQKFDKIKTDIVQGKLGVVRYFHSGNFRGELSNVPRVIVGAEYRHVIELCRDMFATKDAERLSRHPFQILQLKQIRLQLDAFAGYAARHGLKDIEAIYRRDAEIVRTILQEKSVKEGIRLGGEWESDRVFLAIQKELEKLK